MKDEIKEIRKLTGLSQAKFAKKYEIPLSTLESWERGTREPASYVINLLEFKVKKIYKESKQGGSLGSLFFVLLKGHAKGHAIFGNFGQLWAVFFPCFQSNHKN